MFYIRIVSRMSVLMLLLATFACTGDQAMEPVRG